MPRFLTKAANMKNSGTSPVKIICCKVLFVKYYMLLLLLMLCHAKVCIIKMSHLPLKAIFIMMAEICWVLWILHVESIISLPTKSMWSQNVMI